jgi:hypothetical protein
MRGLLSSPMPAPTSMNGRTEPDDLMKRITGVTPISPMLS